MKIKELAEELKLDANELKEMLVEMGLKVKTVASQIDEATAKTIREVVNEVNAEVKEDKSAKKPKAQPAATKPKAAAPHAKAAKKVPAVLPKVEKPDSRRKHKPEKAEEVVVEEEWTEEELAPPPSDQEGEGPVEGEISELTLPLEHISLRDLAEQLKINSSDIIKELIKDGIMLTINQEVNVDVAKKIGEKFNVIILAPEQKVDNRGPLEKSLIKEEENKDRPEKIKRRPPVVTIMGHVDHGKTMLLDTVRNANVIATEAGGITQHIGAYQVKVNGKKVTFLDTPGHAAFTALRARGAQVTDIVVLIVAADDGVKPQTIEAIDHAKVAGVPIVVAINKIDKPEANIEKVKQQLTEFQLVSEEWGGDTVMVPISAKENKGIKELLEMILLVAELKELKANADCHAKGVIIEARLSRKRGPVATILIQKGTLKKGDTFIIGTAYSRVRAMFNDQGVEVKKATPSMPVEVLGLSTVPPAGEFFMAVANESTARAIAEERQEIQGDVLKPRHKISLENFSKEIKAGQKKELNLIIKADVQGSIEALSNAIQKIRVENVHVHILHEATGVVNESDILLAKASGAIVLGFSVTMNTEAQKVAETEGVDVRLYNIIYKALEDIELAMEGMLEPEYEEVVVGTAEVRDTFKSSKSGVIAGCFVIDGKIIRNAAARVMRKKEFIYEGKIDSLKRFKDDAKEVSKGYECGISFKGFNDIKQGDIIKAIETREKPRARKKDKKQPSRSS